jgi:phenylpropionate dioxygenase-like ring-hydroxylating dioxygenase large terminal subunit
MAHSVQAGLAGLTAADPLRHWQPVLHSRQLGRRPRRVTLGERELVLFRTRGGRLGALQARCAHRGMPLSRGKVIGETLQCAYHGWCYQPDGSGLSRGSPRLRVELEHYDVEERCDLIWIKSSRSAELFPELAPAEFRHAHSFWAGVPVPVELLLDNFTEIEHTGVAHWLFGYPDERLDEVTFETSVEDGAVHGRSVGPQKPLPPGSAALLGIGTGDRFVVDWKTYGQPLQARYSMYWEDPQSGARRPMSMYEIAYFGQLSPTRSWVAALYFVDPRGSKLPAAFALMKLMVAALVEVEYRLDVRLLTALRSQEASLRNCRLSRFDTALVAQRRLFFPDQEQR